MEELKKLNGKKVSLKTLEEVECSMHVLSIHYKYPICEGN